MSQEKQIEEMACAMCGNNKICVGEGVEKCLLYPTMWRYANNAYREGYHKQSEGEWIKDNTSKFEHRYNCSVCNYRFFGIPTNYCPNCGAKIKGGITRE